MTTTRLSLLVATLLLSAPALAADALPEPIQEQVTAALGEGLPDTPLREKAREGLAKGLPAARIAPVVEQLRLHMRDADKVLGHPEGADRDLLLHASAIALQAGSSPEGLAEVVQARHRVRAMWCYGDLLGLGAGEKAAIELVQRASEADDPSATYRGAVEAMSRLRGMGHHGPGAAGEVQRAMRQGNPPLSSVSSHAGGPGKGHGQGHKKPRD